MRGVRRLTGIWRGASFSLKFAAVILVAGMAIAVVPLMLADASARTQAENSAADKASIASNLLDGQRASLAGFIAGVGRQLATDHDVAAPEALRATLIADTSVIGTGDVLGILTTAGQVVAVQGSTVLSTASMSPIANAVSTRATTAVGPGGRAWLVATSTIPGSSTTAFVARPLTAGLIAAVAHNIATAADPVGILLVDGGRTLAATGSLTSLTPELAGAIATQVPSVVSLNSHSYAVASTAIGSGLHTGGGDSVLRFADRMAVDPAAGGGDPGCDALHRHRRADRPAPSPPAA